MKLMKALKYVHHHHHQNRSLSVRRSVSNVDFTLKRKKIRNQSIRRICSRSSDVRYRVVGMNIYDQNRIRSLSSRTYIRKSRNETKKIKLTVAPMMKVTNYHFRRLFEEVFRAELECDELGLYTEMMNVNLLLRGDRVDVERALRCTPDTTILQIGGNCENAFRDVGIMLKERGYDNQFQGININAGCPSPRVSGDGMCFCYSHSLTHSLTHLSYQHTHTHTQDVSVLH